MNELISINYKFYEREKEKKKENWYIEFFY